MIKYCSRKHPVSRTGESKISGPRRNLINIKNEVEPSILWRIIKVTLHSSGTIGQDLGPLPIFIIVKLTRNLLLLTSSWNITKLKQFQPGNFEVSSAWRSLRQSQGIALTNKSLWHKALPFQFSFFNWKLLENRIPIDDNVKKKGVSLPSRCECCENYCNENLEHLFKRNNFSKNIWNVFRYQFGLEEVGGGINQEMMVWWTAKTHNPIHKIMIQIMPLLISCQIWKARCKKRQSWGMWWWGNFQGSSRGICLSFSAPLVSNNVAESLALSIGIEWCKENGINMVIVDLDSSLVISWVTGKMKPPWNLRHSNTPFF
ncbi:hypothetical protein MTR67_013692 [Solanum verrucosum]|uniref:RNase H type-1 domain-containing protein n=1 Tax=Solanum verrucosum TaxID=315347 RepID=A0AAF0QAX8_SOLVR|nr:hypothetical protein MTR67_013692 [Solanum verrucosum]